MAKRRASSRGKVCLTPTELKFLHSIDRAIDGLRAAGKRRAKAGSVEVKKKRKQQTELQKQMRDIMRMSKI